MKRIFLLSVCTFAVLLVSLLAGEDPATAPEEVVRMYQAYVDQNEFDKAGTLSTTEEQQRLKELQSMIEIDAEESILYTAFESIQCETKINTAICNCLLKDQYESYEAVFHLIKENNEWLVDLPEEQDIEYDEEIEAVLDSLLQESNN